MGLGGEVDDCVDAGDRVGDGHRVLDRPVHEAVLDIAQILAAASVGQLVEHDDLVTVVGSAQAHEVRADEPGTAADEQLHRGLPVVIVAARAARKPARPSRQSGRWTASSARSLTSTLKAGRGVGEANAAVVVGST